METVSDKTRARTDRAYITWKRITQVSDKTSFTVRTHGMFAGITGKRITQVSDYTGFGLDMFYCIYLRDGWGSERTL